MGIRVATMDDIEVVLKLAERFTAASDYAKYVEPVQARALAEYFLKGDPKERIVLLYDDIGIIAGSKNQFTFGPMFIASEVLWWVDEEHRKGHVGIHLLEAFEYWAKRAGCAGVAVSSLDDAVGKLYENLGYKLYERAYFKEI